MNTRQLRYFCATVESGSLTRAAERLFVAPTAISMQLAQLEQEIGGALFDRSVKPMALTALGKYFLPRANELVAQGQRLELDVKEVAKGRQGWLGIGFVRSLMYSIVPRAVRVFRAAHPNVKLELLELLSESQPEQLRNGRIHIGLSRHTHDADPPAGLAHTELFQDPFVAAFPAEHAFAKGRSVTMKQLSQIPYISFPRDPTSGYSSHVFSLLHGAGAQPRVEYEAVEIHTALGLVAAGLGYAIVGRSVAERSYHDVAFLALKGLTASTAVLAVTRTDEESPLAASMLSTLRSIHDVKPIRAASKRKRLP